MNYIDLFSGIGGFAIGAYWAGMKFDNHYFSEVDPYCVELYQKRFPDAIPLGDIREIDTKILPGGDYIVTGGFPCQDISVAGKGAGIEGSRSGLWSEMRRIISEVQPRYALIENVGAIVIRGLETVLCNLAEIGYDAEWQDIRAEDMGAPHRRERIYIISYPNSQYGNNTGHGAKKVQQQEPSEVQGYRWWDPEPTMGRMVDGLPDGLDRFKGRHSVKSHKRRSQVRGLGNSIVPQIAMLLFSRVKELLSE